MRDKTRHYLILLLAFAMSLQTSFANVQTGSIPLKEKSEKDYSSLARVSLRDAIIIANKNTPGQVVEASLEKDNGFLFYEVEIATSAYGKKEILVDASTGEIVDNKKHGSKD